MPELDARPTSVATPTVHEHAWVAESRHLTSEGMLLYVRCVGCDARRIDLQSATQLPPVAVSRAFGA